MSIARGLRVLIVAPNASSAFGGEAFLPLKYFQLLRQRGHPVRMIVHIRNRANLMEALDGDLQRVHFIEDTRWHRLIWTVGQFFPAPVRAGIFDTMLNLLNERYIARLIRSLIDTGDVDLIHQPIPVSPKTPSSLYDFGPPIVIGPMNGGMTYPAGYEDLESASARRFIAAARMAAIAMNRLIPGKRKAAALLVANERTQAALPVVDHPRVVTLVENGVDLSIWRPDITGAAPSVRQSGEPFRLVFMGRLIALKAVDITIDAVRLARAEGIDVRLDVLGDGDMRTGLEAQVRQLGLAGVVQFHGFRPQSECALILSSADAMILNSVHECGGAVVLEAMGLGLPVVASDWGGPADYVDPTCGVLVSPTPRADFAARLADAIGQLALDPYHARAMGEAGRQKIEKHFDWERKTDQMLALYREVLKANVVGTPRS